MGLTVAVTGPTGEIGISAVTALERDPAVDRIVGMARRPFDPALHGWTKTTYQQGDIMDRDAVDALVADADVVIHLAFIVLGSRAESERVNLAGTRIVFEAAVAAERVTRLVYTSSAAAYGYYSDNPDPITEDVPPRGSPEHDYSAQKAACEAALAEITYGSSLEVFVLRPCIVAGPKATALADAMPWNRLPSAYPVDHARDTASEDCPSPTPVSRFSSSIMTTSPRPSHWRRRRRHRRGPTTSPRTARHRCRRSRRRWADVPYGCPPPPPPSGRRW